MLRDVTQLVTNSLGQHFRSSNLPVLSLSLCVLHNIKLSQTVVVMSERKEDSVCDNHRPARWLARLSPLCVVPLTRSHKSHRRNVTPAIHSNEILPCERETEKSCVYDSIGAII